MDTEIAKKVAELIHNKTCHYNHTDGCGWLYETDWDNCWESSSHQQYLNQATQLLSKNSVSEEEIKKAILLSALEKDAQDNIWKFLNKLGVR